MAYKGMIDARGVSYDPEQPFMDITAPEGEVYVRVDTALGVMYVDIAGVTVFRICRATKIITSEE